MNRKYAVFNMSTGDYTMLNTIDEALDNIRGKISEYIDLVTARCPVTVVDIAEDGTETWRNIDGVSIPTKAELDRQIAEIRNRYSWVGQ